MNTGARRVAPTVMRVASRVDPSGEPAPMLVALAPILVLPVPWALVLILAPSTGIVAKAIGFILLYVGSIGGVIRWGPTPTEAGGRQSASAANPPSTSTAPAQPSPEDRSANTHLQITHSRSHETIDRSMARRLDEHHSGEWLAVEQDGEWLVFTES